MKPALVVATIVVAAALIGWIRGGEGFPLPQAIPLCGGKSPSFAYDLLGGLGLVMVALWGLGRVARLGRPTEECEEEPAQEEAAETEEPEEEGPQEDELAEYEQDEPEQVATDETDRN